MLKPLQHLRAADEDAELGTAAGGGHQRGRGREAQRAGAGHDQDGHARGDRRLWIGPGAQPEPERGDGRRQHDRHEDTGHRVGQPLGARLACLRIGDQTGDAGEPSVGTDGRGPYEQQPTGVDGPADHGRARPGLDRLALPGDQGEVHGRTALHHLCVGGDPLARPYDEDLAAFQLFNGNKPFGIAVSYRHLLGGEFGQ
ncbi:hypothetical protein SAMN02787118_111185 [Streptomyces mirabilis]|uniref:Uncharacterized protein n=1 Tax=Streptomyces mirabilis TaxID=68239 RepID=A0A1I2L2K7_9ACTN|nr:hypothetical protein SAMN02787118_111185 [Streptomyces mirabilis]